MLARTVAAPANRLIEGTMANMPMFRFTARAHVAELAPHVRSQHVTRGHVIFRRGDRIEGFYAVAYGMVKLALRGPGGEEKVLRLVGPGETFGEAAMYLERPVTLDAVALADSMILFVSAAPAFALIARDPGFARGLLASMSQRMFALVADLEDASLRDGLQRVAAYLGSLAENGAPAPGVVRLPATKTVIASRLGVTKETFSRLLRELGAMGLIQVRKREIALLDANRLGEVARGRALA
jgi:CRP-like cAMP-binding protein